MKKSLPSAAFFWPIFAICIALFAILWQAQPASAQTTLDFQILMERSGGIKGPLNTLNETYHGMDICPSDPADGCDYSDTDNIIRTNDTVRYTFAYNIDGGSENLTINSALTEGFVWDYLPGFCLADTSSITGDGSAASPSTLVCDLGLKTLGTAENLPFYALPLGTAPSGSQVDIASATIEAPSIGPIQPALKPDPLTVTATPRWNLRKSLRSRSSTNINGQVYALVYYNYWVETWETPHLGNEALTDPIVIVDDVSQIAPAAELNSCYISGYFYTDVNTAPNKAASVKKAGTVSCDQPGGPGTNINITVTGADTSLSHVPTQYSWGAATPAGRKIATFGTVSVLIPSDYILAQSGGELSTTNTYINFDPNGISGNSNFGSGTENTSDNASTLTIPARSGSWSKIFYRSVGSFSPPGTASGNWHGNGFVGPGESFASHQYFGNSGVDPLNNVAMCDVIDSNTYVVTDIAATPGQAVQRHTSSSRYTGTYVVEYGTGYVNGTWPPASLPNAAAVRAECGDPTDSTGWHTSTTDVPGGAAAVTKVRVRLLEPLPAGEHFRFWINHTALGSNASGQIPNNTVLPNFGVYTADELTSGNWSSNSYNPGVYPAGHSGTGHGDRVMLTRAVARITKETIPNDSVDSVIGGGTVEFLLEPTLTSTSSSFDTTVSVVDTLPTGMTYVANSATQGGVPFEPIIGTDGNGDTTLTWDLGTRTINQAIASIQFKAAVELTLPNNTRLENQVTIFSPDDGAAENLRTATRSIIVANPEGMKVFKEVHTPVIEAGEQIEYTIHYANLATIDYTSVDVIDILPYIGDSRLPATAYTGTHDVVSVVPAGASALVYYTNLAPASINADPDHASNDLGGGSTTWCQAFSFNTGSCPAGLTDVTAIRILDSELLAPTDSRTFDVTLVTYNNRRDNVYTNSASGRSPQVILLAGSNHVNTVVVESTIGDTIWYDRNGNGSQDAGEFGLAGVTVELRDSGGILIDSAVTDANGYYIFLRRPAGDYTVTVDDTTLPIGMIQTGDPDGTTDHQTGVTVAQNSDHFDADFGYRGTSSIGDTIWTDDDGDGSQNGGESGISGVTVMLTHSNGYTETTTTAANGSYLFADLPGGPYTVTVASSTLPVNIQQTGDPDGTFDHTNVVNLGANDDHVDADFGYQPLGSVGDTVWLDADGDGTDNSESGIPNVLLTLINDAGDVFTTTTAADGTYLISDLPMGTYTMTVDSSTLPADVAQSYDLDGLLDHRTTFDLGPDEDRTDVDFAYQPLAAIGNYIWYDDNGDGVQDAGEAGIPNVTLVLRHPSSALVMTTTTDANGGYLFDDLPMGGFTVEIVQSSLPVDLQQSYDLDGTLDHQSSVTLVNGDGKLDVDFGYQPLGSIGDTIWMDIDGNGSQNGEEAGISGITVTLNDVANGTNFTTVTDISGTYTFTGLPMGNYIVSVDPATIPIVTVQTSDPDGSLDHQTTVNLAADEDHLDADFGYQPQGSIGDTIWSDDNGDGIQDIGETGIPSVTVRLTLPDGTSVSQITNSSGSYTFAGVPQGNYTVTVDVSTLSGVYQQTGDPDATIDHTTVVDLAINENHVDADFGYQPLGSIGDTIWFDDDGDGAQNGGEMGIANVVVTLEDANGTVYTTTTNINGSYVFTNLVMGDYTVTVDPVSINDLVRQTGDPDATLNHNTNVTLGPGEEHVDADFGYQLLGSIGDTVWNDHDGNGVQEPNEPAIPGVVVSLLDSGGSVIMTTTTNISGTYLFSELPMGSYTVEIDASTVPGDVEQSGDPDGTLDDATTLQLAPGEDHVDADFGYQPFGTIGDTIWFDDDGDGVQDIGEPIIPTVTVSLIDSSGAVLMTTTTDTSGLYRFTHLPMAAYTVTVDGATVPGPVKQTGDPDATLDNANLVDLGPGEEHVDADFGYQKLGSIGDTLWLDHNGDGIQSPNEALLPNITVSLLDTSGVVIMVATTNVSGTYTFSGLPMGNYTVKVDPGTLPIDLHPSYNVDGTLNHESPVRLEPGQERVDVDFGYQKIGSIGDTVWTDLDGDGSQDAGESGIPGATVKLLNSSGAVVATTTTGSNGSYLFSNLPMGGYTVNVVKTTLPANMIQSYDLDGTLNHETAIPLGAGEHRKDADFGYQPLGTIGNTIWTDLDGNGSQDAGEAGIPGVTITLTGSSGTVVGTTTTDANGQYKFIGLPVDSYTVAINSATLPINHQQTGDPDATLDHVNLVALGPGEDHVDADFGYQPLGSIGDTIWHDIQENGVQDAGEPGIAGVSVSLTDVAGSVIATTTTNGSGRYRFEGLVAGEYKVIVDPASLPAATMYQTGDPDGTNDHSTTVTLTNGQVYSAADFGYRSPDPLGSIGDTIWTDADGNGVQDGGETGIGNVLVSLLDGSGNVVTSMFTDANGQYLFQSIVAGSYTVQVDPTSLPAAILQTGDPDGAMDNHAVVVLPAGTNHLDADFGYQPVHGSIGDRVWQDDNRNGLQDGGETGVSGVSVTLYDAATNQPVTDAAGSPMTAVTDGGGSYLFQNISAGSYYVGFDLNTLPTRYLVTEANAGGDDNNDSDADPNTGQTATLTIPANGASISHLDMGIYRPGNVSVGSQVWLDSDKDGEQDAGEPGVAGVSVSLYDATTGQLIAETFTDSAGAYLFNNLPEGNYYVSFGLNTLPANHIPTIQNASGVNDSVDSDAEASSGQSEPTGALTAGQSYLTLNMGIVSMASVSVGNIVWHDKDADGIQDPTEPGVAGIGVALYDATTGKAMVDDQGNPVTTVTDSNGNYLFEGLPSGQYYVIFDLDSMPAGYVVTTPNQDITDSIDSDADPVTGQTAPTDILVNGESDKTLHMGIWAPVQVGQTVWDDQDGNGVHTPEEPTVSGIGVTLYDANTGQPVTDAEGNPLTDITDENGNYLFENLPPGSYYVVFDTAALPEGYAVTAQNSSSNDDADSDADPNSGQTESTGPIPSGGQDLSPGMGIVQLVQVGSTVWLDADRNGLQEGSEAGLPGVGVTLYDAMTGQPATDTAGELQTMVTGEDGTYLFDNLMPGNYYVNFDLATLPESHAVTSANAGDDSIDSDANPANGQTGETGFLMGGESALNMNMGVVTIAEIVRIGDKVWEDANANGLQEPSEPGVSGIEVLLYQVGQPNAPIATAVTAEDGTYLFDELESGDYYVVFNINTLPEGAVVSTPNIGGDDLLDSDADPVTGQSPSTGFLDEGSEDYSLDMGLYFTGDLSDRVWHDLDGDGTQDAGEPGVSGVSVILYNKAGEVVGETVTDESGQYTFTSLLPGDYQVEYIVPESYGLSPVDQGSDEFDSDASFTGEGCSNGGRSSQACPPNAVGPVTPVESGEVAEGGDMGLFTGASIGNFVWDDVNGDGLQGATEQGIPNVPIQLFSEAGELIAETVSDGNGFFGFSDLPPGEYYAEFTPPADSIPSRPNQGDNSIDSDVDPVTNQTQIIPIQSGESNPNLDAGFTLPAMIGNYVWLDIDKNGMFDEDEAGIAGITVRLYDGEGNLIEEVLTDNNGRFVFVVPPGIYQIQFILSSEFNFTQANQGTNDGADSDADPETGFAPISLLNPGDSNLSVFAGLNISPTAIELLSLLAIEGESGITVQWMTGSELETFSFEVYRSLNGKFEGSTRITDNIIPAQGSGGLYEFTDSSAIAGQIYSYWLVENQNDGSTYTYGPARVIAVNANSVQLSLFFLPIINQ